MLQHFVLLKVLICYLTAVPFLQAKNDGLLSEFDSLDSALNRIEELEARLARYETSRPQGNASKWNASEAEPLLAMEQPGRANWFDSGCTCPTIAGFFTGESWKDYSEFSWPNNYGGRIGLDASWRVSQSGA